MSSYTDSSCSDASDESDSDFGGSNEGKSVSPFKFKFKEFKAKVRHDVRSWPVVMLGLIIIRLMTDLYRILFSNAARRM